MAKLWAGTVVLETGETFGVVYDHERKQVRPELFENQAHAWAFLGWRKANGHGKHTVDRVPVETQVDRFHDFLRDYGIEADWPELADVDWRALELCENCEGAIEDPKGCRLCAECERYEGAIFEAERDKDRRVA